MEGGRVASEGRTVVEKVVEEGDVDCCGKCWHTEGCVVKPGGPSDRVSHDGLIEALL